MNESRSQELDSVQDIFIQTANQFAAHDLQTLGRIFGSFELSQSTADRIPCSYWEPSSLSSSTLPHYSGDASLDYDFQSNPSPDLVSANFPIAAEISNIHQIGDRVAVRSGRVIEAEPMLVQEAKPVQAATKTRTRTRIDRKKRVKGNNAYGRKGNKRCGECRKRRWKCVYTSESQPCDLCRDRKFTHPCVKLAASTEIVTQSPSRPLPAVIDGGEIDAEDVSALQFAYSKGITLLASFIKQMAVTFGVSIRPAPLRHAVLAYAALHFPAQQSRRNVEYHCGKASSVLLKRLDNPNQIADSDVFAAMVLAWIELCRGSTADSLVHAYGCMSMLEVLDNGRLPGRASDLLATFAPLILDNMNSVLAVGGALPQKPSAGKPSSFGQRLIYYQELCRTGSPPEAWQSTVLETMHNYFRGAIGSVIVELRQIATLERNGAVDGESVRAAQSALEYIKAKTEDPDFRRTFAGLGRTFREKKESGEVAELQLLRFQSTSLQALELLQSIIQGQNVLQGITSDNTLAIAERLLSSTEASRRPVEELWYYRDAYYCHLPLCGLVLTPEEPYECNFPSPYENLNTVGWIVGELEECGMYKTTKMLKLWWRARNYETLIGLLNTYTDEWWAFGEKWN